MATEFYFEDLYLRDAKGNRYCGPLEGWCRCDAGSVTGIDLPAWTALDTSFAKAERKGWDGDAWRRVGQTTIGAAANGVLERMTVADD